MCSNGLDMQQTKNTNNGNAHKEYFGVALIYNQTKSPLFT